MYENNVRAGFSFLAAAVTLSMAQEWMGWAAEENKPWKYVPAGMLAVFSMFEARKVWQRVERGLGLMGDGGV